MAYRVVEKSETEYYEFTEDEMREKLGLPSDFHILTVLGLGPFKIVRYHEELTSSL